MSKYVIYQHKDNSTNFVGMADDKLPVWAINPRYVDELPNMAGLPEHYTDRYIWWSESNIKEKMLNIRQMWDRVVAAGLEKELRYIVDTACQTAILETSFDDSGEVN